MKKYVLIIAGVLLLLVGTVSLQAAASMYPPNHIESRLRDGALDISWKHNSDNPYPVDNYKIYWDTDNGNWPFANSLEVDGIYHWAEITGLTNDTLYYILVSAIEGGVESDTSVAQENERPCPANTTVSRFIPGGTTVNAYTMISTPVEPQNTKISAVLGDDLGPYDNTQWRCFHWEQDKGDYDEGSVSNNDFGPNDGEPLVGNAAWLITRNDVTIDVTGCAYDHYYPSSPDDFEINLEPGWNQVGCPYNVRILWNNTYVENPASPGNWYEITDGLNTWVEQQAWGWYDSAYKSMINLVPMHGFFLRNKTAGTVKIKIYRPASPPSGPDYSAPAPGEDYDPVSYAPAYTGGSGGGPPPPPGVLSSGLSSSGGGGGCFIATAAFGTPMAEEVKILSKLRDEHLLTNPLGRGFVKMYYKTSPPLAEFIRNKPGLKAVVRVGLKPLVWFAKWLL